MDQDDGDLAPLIRPTRAESTRLLPRPIIAARWVHAETRDGQVGVGLPEIGLFARPHRPSDLIRDRSFIVADRGAGRCPNFGLIGRHEEGGGEGQEKPRLARSECPIVRGPSQVASWSRPVPAAPRVPGKGMQDPSLSGLRRSQGRCLNRTWRATAIEAGLVGLHAGEGGEQHRLQGHSEGGRGIMDRDGRATLGAVRPRPETGELPSRPPTADGPCGLPSHSLAARDVVRVSRSPGTIPSHDLVPRSAGQLDLRGQGLEHRVEDP